MCIHEAKDIFGPAWVRVYPGPRIYVYAFVLQIWRLITRQIIDKILKNWKIQIFKNSGKFQGAKQKYLNDNNVHTGMSEIMFFALTPPPHSEASIKRNFPPKKSKLYSGESVNKFLIKNCFLGSKTRKKVLSCSKLLV